MPSVTQPRPYSCSWLREPRELPVRLWGGDTAPIPPTLRLFSGVFCWKLHDLKSVRDVFSALGPTASANGLSDLFLRKHLHPVQLRFRRVISLLDWIVSRIYLLDWVWSNGALPEHYSSFKVGNPGFIHQSGDSTKAHHVCKQDVLKSLGWIAGKIPAHNQPAGPYVISLKNW